MLWTVHLLAKLSLRAQILLWSVRDLSVRTVVALCTQATWLGHPNLLAVVSWRTQLAILNRRSTHRICRTHDVHFNSELNLKSTVCPSAPGLIKPINGKCKIHLSSAPGTYVLQFINKHRSWRILI